MNKEKQEMPIAVLGTTYAFCYVIFITNNNIRLMMALSGSGHNDRVFFVSMTMLILCLILFFFSLYLLPFLIWNLNYDIPEFIFIWQESLKQNYNYTTEGAAVIIFMAFFIPAIVFGYFAKYFTHTLTDESSSELDESNLNQEELKRVSQKRVETLQFAFKLFLMIILVFIVLSLIEWLVAIPPPV